MEQKPRTEINQSTEGNATYTATKELKMFCLENSHAPKTFSLTLMENYRKYDKLLLSLIKV